MTIDNAKKGDILLFTNGYYTDEYVAEVISVGDRFIQTNIPHLHSLMITKDNNWDYHKNRSKVIGDNTNKALVKRLNDPKNGHKIK